MHFPYIHSEIVSLILDGNWIPGWARGNDPDLIKKMTNSNPTYNEYRMNLIKRFVTEENKKYIGVISLDNQMSIFGSKYFDCYSFSSWTWTSLFIFNMASFRN